MANKLKELLGEVLSEKELGFLVGSYDVVGDMAIIIVPPELSHRQQLIGSTILKSNSRIKVVARRAGIYGGEFRTLPLQILAGEERKETELRESGVRLLVNPETVYFSVRSGGERKRIASLVREGEKVLVLFSGIAPYPLIISKYSRAKLIVGVEKNPIAHDYGLKNLRLNKRLNNIQLVHGDAKAACGGFTEQFDRLVMPLPGTAQQFLEDGLGVLRPGGTLHFYQMQNPDSFSAVIEQFCRMVMDCCRLVESASLIRCGHCGPKTYRICVDALIR